MQLRVLVSALALLGAACTPTANQQGNTAPVATGGPQLPAKPQIGEFGLDLSAGNPKIKPGDDFFAFASGHWYDTFQIPADHARFGAFHQLDELSTQRVRKIIETAAASPSAPGSAEQKIGDYYASFMDQATIDALGLKPAQADLGLIAAAKSKKDIATLFGLAGFVSPFGLSLPPDLKNASRYSIAISQSGLGLPDRDYYLKDDPKLAEIRKAYSAYIEQILGLGGAQNAPAKARKIMAFETAIAKAQWSIQQQRDVEKNYNPRSKSQLLKFAPGFDWQAFFQASEVGSRSQFVLGELTAIADLAKLVDRSELATLQDYLTFHYLSDHAAVLPKPFDEATFAFYGRTLRGQPQQRERWKRAVDAMDGALGEELGRVYVKNYFPAESKAKMQHLVTNLLAALKERLAAVPWMTDATKVRAQEKLASFVTKIGYPDKWKDYSTLQVSRGDAIGNERRAALWDWHRRLARLDDPVDRDEWDLTPQTVNAYYNPLNNEIVFPAAILQPPFFDPNADDAVNYGGIGAVIGHEIGHGFDDQGRKFGPTGSMVDWWTAADAKAFNDRTAKLIAQYSSFEALPGLKVNGAITVGENIGDLGGLNMAYQAYHRSLDGKPAPVLGGLSGDQRFFLAYAQIWRSKSREGAMREQVLSDVHSPEIFRTNGAVRNMDAWYAAFDVQPGQKLYLDPKDRVTIWW
jgi:putative endopeptidase